MKQTLLVHCKKRNSSKVPRQPNGDRKSKWDSRDFSYWTLMPNNPHMLVNIKFDTNKNPPMNAIG